jgi:uncharacterized membrane protein YbhN (UPF0104 family)
MDVFERFFRPLLGSPQREGRLGPPPPPPSNLRRVLVRWLPVILVLGGCAFLGASVDLVGLRSNLLSVRLAPLGLAIVLAGLGALAHAAYWWTLLAPSSRVPLRAMAEYTFASSAASVLLPFRAGEALRVWLLRRHYGVPLVLSGAVIALEKVGDILALLLLVSPLPWLVPDLPPTIGQALRVLPLVVAGVLVAVAVASRGGGRIPWLSGFKVVHDPRLVAKGFLFVLIAWLIDVSAILTVLWALRVGPSLGRALVVLLLVNVAIAIPAAPGQVGSHELGSTVALELLGVPSGQAVAFALVFHATQLAPVLLLGLYSARVLSKLEDPPRPSPGSP